MFFHQADPFAGGVQRLYLAPLLPAAEVGELRVGAAAFEGSPAARASAPSRASDANSIRARRPPAGT
jgi:hypothetical protein